MSVVGFIGAAGTGKTTRLMDDVNALFGKGLQVDERVLALTRMHGSRFRLIDKLKSGIARGRFDCYTFDRFAWSVVSRWRCAVRELGMTMPGEFEYDTTCQLASELLTETSLKKWIARRFPIIVVDEFQDCRDGRLSIVHNLSDSATLLVAADEFQNLEQGDSSNAVEWLRANGLVHELTDVHRTKKQGLLAAATAIRSCKPIQNGAGFKVFSAPQAHTGAALLSRQFTWNGGDQIAVITPTGPGSSPFIRNVFEKVQEKEYKGRDGQKFGPHRIEWELSDQDIVSKLCEKMQLPSNPEKIVDMSVLPWDTTTISLPGLREIEHWLDLQKRLLGVHQHRCEELRLVAQRSVRQHRGYARSHARNLALTVQQAKNREFKRVVVLWPLEVAGNIARHRRLLYNAITRAQDSVVVIVQDPKKDRLQKPPFEMNAEIK